MKLHSTNNGPTTSAILVCRNTRSQLLILMAVFWAIPAVWWWIGIRWLAYACGALAAMLTPLFFGSWRRRGRPDN